MPQRFFRRLESASIRKRRPTSNAKVNASLRQAAANALIGAVADMRPTMENLEGRTMLSSSPATFFVSPTGSDNNTGTLSAPFKSISRASTVAQPGDMVEIETGVYHETVTPKISGTPGKPITYQAYKGENVTISGADAITGWTSYGNSIYKASMPSTLGVGNDEIFVNNVEMSEAAYPNSTLNPSSPATEAIQKVTVSGNSATIYDSGLTQAAGYWKGAIIHMAPGQQWVDQTGVVTASNPGSVTFSFQNGGKYETPQVGDPFYIIGKLQSLTGKGQWYRDPSGNVYLETTTGTAPTGMDVEAKARLYAFDLSSVHDITIQGVNVFSSTIKTTSTSSDVVINGITATYVSKFDSMPTGWWVNPVYGITLKGKNDVLENSNIGFSSGDCVEVSGTNVLVTNNVIHDGDTIGGDLGDIRILVGGNTISHNTVYNSGRDGIYTTVGNVKILYNTVSNVGLQTTEPGGIYTVASNGGGNSVIAYNTVSAIHTGGYGGTAIFLDNSSSGWTVHDNVTSKVDYSLKMNFTSNNNLIYNNTFSANDYSIYTNGLGNWNGVKIYNNIFLTAPNYYKGLRGATATNNVSSMTVGIGAVAFTSGASGVVTVTPPVTTPPVTTPPVTTPPVTTPPVTTPPVTTPPVTTPPVTTTPSAFNVTKAVNYNDHYAVKGDNFGGIGYAYNNNWVEYTLDFGTKGATKITAALAAIHLNGKIEIHVGSPSGALAGTINVASTGAWNNYKAQSATITKLTGVQKIYLVFKGSPGVANIDWLQFA